MGLAMKGRHVQVFSFIMLLINVPLVLSASPCRMLDGYLLSQALFPTSIVLWTIEVVSVEYKMINNGTLRIVSYSMFLRVFLN